MPREDIDPNGKTRKAYARWFAKNREKLNQTRRGRYKTDTEYRKTIVARQAGYRTTLSPKHDDGSRYRVIGGEKILILSMSQVGRLVGRSPQTLRIWETKEWIPAHTTGGVHRFYTQGQAQLMLKLAIQVDRLGKASQDAEFIEMVKYVHEKWKDA
jgi:hypothetical protein